MQSVAKKGIDLDPTTLLDELQSQGILARAGGRTYVTRLDECGFSRNVDSYVVKVREASLRRKIKAAVRDGDDAAKIGALVRELDQVSRGAWERPTPFREFRLPPFPTSALPDWLRDYVVALAESTQTPADLAAMMSLAVCAAACAKRVVVRVRADYTEPVNLYTLTIMASGTRKTAVTSDTTHPLRAQEEVEAERIAPQIAKMENRRAILEERIRGLRKIAAKERDPAKRNALTEKSQGVTSELASLRIPPYPRFVADDATPERVETLLEQHGGRLAILSSEGTIFDVLAGLYSSKGMANLDVFLKGHSGEDLRVDRMGRPPVFVKRPALTLGLSAQPEVLRGLLTNQRFRGRGLVARFLFSVPSTLLGTRKIDPAPLPANVRTRYQARILDLLALPPAAVDPTGGPAEHELTLSEPAHEAWREFLDRLEPRLHPYSGDLASLADWAGKLSGAVIRVAGVLHMARHAEGRAPWTHAIDAETMTQALEIGHYLTDHARAAFAEMGADPEVENAKHVLAWIKRQRENNLRERDIFQGTRGRFRRMDSLRPALNLLVQHGFLRRVDPSPSTGAGRPAGPTYHVSPHVWTNTEDIEDFEHRGKRCQKSALQQSEPGKVGGDPDTPRATRVPEPTPQNPQNPHKPNLETPASRVPRKGPVP